MTTKILIGDALETLRTLPPESVHCIITSPPYFGLRDYGTAEWEGGDSGCDHMAPPTGGPEPERYTTGGADMFRKGNDKQHAAACAKCGATRIDKQLGLEETPEEYLANMVAVFREARRVLRGDGVCFVNMGDSYAGSGKGQLGNGDSSDRRGAKQGTHAGTLTGGLPTGLPVNSNLKPKDLMGMPWRLALALQQPHLQCNGCDNVAHKSAWGHFPNGRMICPACELSKGWAVAEQGWWLRSDIIWNKKNPMPESCTDRPTKAHEYVFLLTKAARYFYDAEAVREGATYGENRATFVGGTDRLTKANICGGGYAPPDNGMKRPKISTRNRRTVWTDDSDTHLDKFFQYAAYHGVDMQSLLDGYLEGQDDKTDIWTIATQPFSAAHFATFPPALVEPMIKAGTSEKGCCPECGGPWERVTEKDTTLAESRRGDENYKSGGLAAGSKFASATPGYSSKVTTTGWRPTCAHDHDPIPCTALDFFAGAFTVGLVADRLGRDSIMIELNPEYAAMGEQRIKDDAGWVADIEVEETAVTQLELI